MPVFDQPGAILGLVSSEVDILKVQLEPLIQIQIQNLNLGHDRR